MKYLVEKDGKATRPVTFEAKGRLECWEVPVRGDLMDFRRIDEYFIEVAPSGFFADGTMHAGVEEEELVEILRTISLHLRDVIVVHGSATDADDDIEENITVDIPTYSEPISLFGNVVQRFITGATADNRIKLDIIASVVGQPYDTLSREYRSPYPPTFADLETITDYQVFAQRTAEALKRLDINLHSDLRDLQCIQDAVQLVFTENGEYRNPLAISGCFNTPYELAVGLGCLLGFTCQQWTGGRWTSHKNVAGISLRENLISDIYPIEYIFRLIRMGVGTENAPDLRSIGYPLVCATIAKRVKSDKDISDQNLSQFIEEYDTQLRLMGCAKIAPERIIEIARAAAMR